ITHQANTHEAARTATYRNCPTESSWRDVQAEIQLYVAGVSARKFNLGRFQKCGGEPQSQSPLKRIIGAARENTSSSLKRLIDCINKDVIPLRLYSNCFFASNNLHSIGFGSCTKCAIKNVPVNHHGFEFLRRITNASA